MTTSTNTTGSGLGFWKVLGIIAVALIALALIGPLLKGLFWVALIALAAYGGWMLLRTRHRSDENRPTTL
ncbi:hypothetical protein [Gordonia soli]|uniref:Uncharacterized protein n=1 Tax=Gordonia soli NBRC 108243 TaxID=1223545 RepID=M0QE93_9ACTN|nr:hypothetical protein [Gordonia soli]GAC66656.1 hypothetical protein GS4_03_01040 [Gordonia soli NBRC 108243]